MIDIQSTSPYIMDSRDIIDYRKRKSEGYLDEIPSKRIIQESIKPESTPKKLLRRISTKIKLLGSSRKGKINKINDFSIRESDEENSSISKCKKLSNTLMTYFPSPQIKISYNDRLSNSSDASHRSSSTSKHMKMGIDLFNLNPNYGLDYLLSNGIVSKEKDLVELFLKKKGFNKKQISEFLGSPKNKLFHQAFCDMLDLKKKTVVEVLHEYLKFSMIQGEYQQMLGITDHLSYAYFNQNLQKDIMGLNIEQLKTIFQFLITYNTNVKYDKSLLVNQEQFVKYLNESLKGNEISRSYALTLYYEITEAPLINIPDTKTKNLEDISKIIVEYPKDFQLLQLHRYIICHVDLCQVIFPSSGNDKISYHDRTLFLFNDCVVITKRRGGYDSNVYRYKETITLTDIKCAFVNRYAIQVVQIIKSIDNITSFYSKSIDDCTNFYSCLDQTITLHKSVVDYQKLYEVNLR